MFSYPEKKEHFYFSEVPADVSFISLGLVRCVLDQLPMIDAWKIMMEIGSQSPKNLNWRFLLQTHAREEDEWLSRGNLGLCYQKEGNGDQTIDVYYGPGAGRHRF